MEKLVTQYLNEAGFEIAEDYCHQLISSHPDYPAIISVADALDQLGVDYVVGRKNKEDIGEIPFPYLLHYDPSKLLLVKSEKDLTDHEPMLKGGWSGIIIKAEEEQFALSSANKKHFKEERDRKLGRSLLIVLAVIALLIPLLTSATLASALWLTTAIAGLTLGGLLVSKELGKAGEKLDEFCSNGKNSDCNTILESDAATLWRGIKLTDMVMGYFAFQVVALLIAALAPSESKVLSHMGYLSWLALPMVIYSYYYQGLVTRLWCKLCLIVSVVLLVQGGMSFFFYPVSEFGSGFQVETLAYMAFVMALFIGLANVLRSRIAEQIELSRDHINAMRIVQSPSVFLSLLSKEPYVSPQQFSRNMTLGNPEAPHSFYLNLSPSCKPCRDWYFQLYEVLQDQAESFKVQLTFAPSHHETAGIFEHEYIVQYWLENLAGLPDETQKTADFLYEWYSRTDSESFQEKHPLKTAQLSDVTRQVLEEQKAWAQSNRVDRSPVMTLNQRLLPGAYHRMEVMAPAMKYILEELPVPASGLPSATESGTPS